jgi:hypothetical protein
MENISDPECNIESDLVYLMMAVLNLNLYYP